MPRHFLVRPPVSNRPANDNRSAPTWPVWVIMGAVALIIIVGVFA